MKLKLLKLKTKTLTFLGNCIGYFNTKVKGVQANYNCHYGKDNKQTLDILYPTKQQNLPCVVYLHGGGWSCYDKSLFRSTCKKAVKSHHNVGGLPEDLKFELCEPIKLLFKDEVRVVGEALGLPHAMVYRQPFPGPGLGVRCLGAITRDRLNALREADAILRDEFDKCGLAEKVWQYFVIIPDIKSVGVKDEGRYEGWPAIIRAVNTKDAMTASIEEIPYAVLHKICARITSEVEGINRVLYDITPKPTGTIEWE